VIQKVEISSRTIIFIVVFLLFLKILWIVREVIYALFLAFIFMSALKPAVNLLERQRIPRFLAALLIFIPTIAGVIFILAFILPPLLLESLSFFRSLPIIIGEAFPFVSIYLKNNALNAFLPDITQNFLKVITGLFSNLIFVISILFFTFYFLLEEKFLKNFLDRFIEEKKSEEIVTVISKAEKRMGAWVWGEVVLMTVIGIMTYTGLSFLQVPYAIPLAVLAGILEVVPIIGPTISAIPAIFVAASTSWLLALYTLILYIVIQQLENNLIVPVVMKKAVGLHPIITLIALTVGGKLGGFLGILLAVPAALFIETILIEIIKFRK